MHWISVGLASVVRQVVALALWLCVLPAGYDADAVRPDPPAAYDYAQPKLLTATLYEIGSGRQKVLYTFRRTATRTNATVHVERQFLDTNGFVVAAETVVYESNRLVSLQMQEFQARVSGAVRLVPDPKDPARQQLFVSYGRGLVPPRGQPQSLPPDTLVDDTLYPFMLAHWDDLMRGDTVKFRFISLEWERTFAFRLVKTAESVRNGRALVQLKMEPGNPFVARLVNPLTFTVEKVSPHYLLSYVGRTTPCIRKGKSWKSLDAETVFDPPN